MKENGNDITRLINPNIEREKGMEKATEIITDMINQIDPIKH